MWPGLVVMGEGILCSLGQENSWNLAYSGIRKWEPTPVFLLRESCEQRSLAGYNSWGHKESDMTYQLNNNNFGGRTEITIDILIKGI